MPFTTVAFFKSITTANAFVTLTPIPDPIFKSEGDKLYLLEPAKLGRVHLYGPYLREGRITTPSLKVLAPLYFNNVTTSLASAEILNFIDFTDSPIPLVATETMTVEALVTDVTAARSIYAIVTFHDGVKAVPAGVYRTLKATLSGSSTANQWSNFKLTFVDDIPVGRYAIIGADIPDSNVLAFRFVLPNTYLRPGGLGRPSTAVPFLAQRKGALGVWGEFDHTLPPSVDLLTTAAITSTSIWLDVVKIA